MMYPPYCSYCGADIDQERILRGLRSNTPARYCGKECAVAAKRSRANLSRAGKARITEGDVRAAILSGQSAPSITTAQVRAVCKRFGKSLAQVAAEAGLPSNQPIYNYMNRKQASLAPMTRMRLHLYFVALEKERMDAHSRKPQSSGSTCVTGRL